VEKKSRTPIAQRAADAVETPGSGSGGGEGAQHRTALDCSAYVRCVEIPSYLVETDGEDMRGSSKTSLT